MVSVIAKLPDLAEAADKSHFLLTKDRVICYIYAYAAQACQTAILCNAQRE